MTSNLWLIAEKVHLNFCIVTSSLTCQLGTSLRSSILLPLGLMIIDINDPRETLEMLIIIFVYYVNPHRTVCTILHVQT